MRLLLGCILLAGGGAWLGFSAAAGLKHRLRGLEELSRGLALLEQELIRGDQELCRLARELGERTRGASRRLFLTFARGLEEQDPERVAVIWARAVESLPGVTEEGRSCLCGLGEVLGRYDSVEQSRAVGETVRALEMLARELRRDYGVRGRLWQTVGLAGGSFLAILLL